MEKNCSRASRRPRAFTNMLIPSPPISLLQLIAYRYDHTFIDNSSYSSMMIGFLCRACLWYYLLFSRPWKFNFNFLTSKYIFIFFFQPRYSRVGKVGKRRRIMIHGAHCSQDGVPYQAIITHVNMHAWMWAIAACARSRTFPRFLSFAFFDVIMNSRGSAAYFDVVRGQADILHVITWIIGNRAPPKCTLMYTYTYAYYV